jgi:molybdate transport system ATP-binding protein
VENGMPGPVSLAIRPEDILLSKKILPENGKNVFSGRVGTVRQNGGLVRVCIDAGIPFRVTLTRPGFEEAGFTPGDAVYLAFRPSAAHVYPSGVQEGA